jgi:glycosyltransferase involved in cell wall biosynthesis
VPPESPLVSVLVPSFNKAQYIEETLQSVYSQTLAVIARVELIVVDDGSTDGSPALLDRHRDRCKVILGPNRGAGAARQIALEHARGEHIQYLDADDLLTPRSLELKTVALEHSGADVAYGDYQRLMPGTAGTSVRGDVIARRIDADEADVEVACFRHYWAPPAALLYRRSLVEKMPPWHAALPVIQDARYLQDAAFAGAKFVHVPEIVALYRQDAGNGSSRASSKRFVRDMLTNTREIEARWRERGALTEAQRKALEDSYGTGARMSFEADDALYEECYAGFVGVGGSGALKWPVVSHGLKSVLGKQRAMAVLRAIKKL